MMRVFILLFLLFHLTFVQELKSEQIDSVTNIIQQDSIIKIDTTIKTKKRKAPFINFVDSNLKNQIPRNYLFIEPSQDSIVNLYDSLHKNFFLYFPIPFKKLYYEIIDAQSIILKKEKNNKVILYYLIFLCFFGILLYFFFKKYIISHYEKIKKINKLLYNLLYNQNFYVKIESYLLLIFYNLNFSFLLYLILYKLNSNIFSGSFSTISIITLISVLLILYGVLKFLIIKLTQIVLNVGFPMIVYKTKLIYKEIYSFFYLFLNCFLILFEKNISTDIVNYLGIGILIAYFIHKTRLFFAIKNNLIKEKYWKSVFWLFISEYLIFIIILYILFQI